MIVFQKLENTSPASINPAPIDFVALLISL
jgi:hypothetical protein